jgi:ABC-type lipoprotein release transport system permease subunit
MLFGVAVLDPITLTAVALVLGLCAAAASFIPARRAAWIDPGTVLKQG